MLLNILKYYLNKSLNHVRLLIVIVLILILVAFLINIQASYIFFLPNNLIFFNEKCNERTKSEPLEKQKKQYFVSIDGEIYPKKIPLFLNDSINLDCLNKSKNIKKILLWNSFFGDRTFWYGQTGKVKPFLKNNCPVTSCELLNNKSRLNESDYVLVHMRNLYDQIPVYPNRKITQKWIFVLYESPKHSASFSNLNGLFNLTATYRLDSNFISYYEKFSKIIWTNQSDYFKNSFNESKDYLKDKSYFAAAVISNCGGSSKRLNLIKKLQNYIKVDVYGNCGKPCPINYLSLQYLNNTGKVDCKDVISREYKFYLSFENSICKDYITEKFFEILFKYPIIPVVLGHGENSDLVYSQYIPKSGYINAFNFKTPKDLANYLIYLSKNSSAYNSYFKWKKYAKRNLDTDYHPLCEMCTKLQLEDHFGSEPSVIKDLENYWNRDGICKYASNSIIDD